MLDRSLHPPHLAGLAAQVVSGLSGASVRSAEVLLHGMMTFKCRVRTSSGEDLIVRFYPRGRSSIVHQEPDLLARCRELGFAVPEPVGDSRSGPPSPLAYMVYRRIEGRTLQEHLSDTGERPQDRLAGELAWHLHRLQELDFEGAGELVSAGRARDASWQAFARQSFHAGLAAIEAHALLPQALRSALRDLADAEPARMAGPAHRLIWGDFNFGNILVTEAGNMAGLIDFEGCLSGDPLATLGYGFATHGLHPFFDLVLRAWPEALGQEALDAIAWYALLRAMRIACYAHLPLPTGRHRDPLMEILPGMLPALQRLTGRLFTAVRPE
ncbi:phosphotransferase family protein [Roseateles sp. DB2]|uniref:phosphotransferase family protein n=1 Tax=Roseateles sp. DB2 TaxID=3453717 RepID=UPI003EE83AF3